MDCVSENEVGGHSYHPEQKKTPSGFPSHKRGKMPEDVIVRLTQSVQFGDSIVSENDGQFYNNATVGLSMGITAIYRFSRGFSDMPVLDCRSERAL